MTSGRIDGIPVPGGRYRGFLIDSGWVKWYYAEEQGGVKTPVYLYCTLPASRASQGVLYAKRPCAHNNKRTASIYGFRREMGSSRAASGVLVRELLKSAIFEASASDHVSCSMPPRVCVSLSLFFSLSPYLPFLKSPGAIQHPVIASNAINLLS